MTLRARLVLAFLALALVPLTILGAFSYSRFEYALGFWTRPGIDSTLSSAVEVSKTSIVRLEATVRAQAETWAEAIPSGTIEPERRPAVSAALPASRLDFLEIYQLEDGRWRRVDALEPPGVLPLPRSDLSGRISEALAGDRVIRGSGDVLAGVWPATGNHAVVAGYRVPPDFFTGIERVGEGLGFYRTFAGLRAIRRVEMLGVLLLLVAALTVAALVVANRLARGMTRPLHELERAVGRVAAGDLEVRVAPGGARELRTLGASFNRMTEELASARGRLLEAERQAAWREVARRLAHEFKNLITPMGLSLHRLRRRVEAVDPAERTAVVDSIDSIGEGVRQLGHLAGQFSQYARLPEPRHEAIDLADVVRSAVRLHEPESVQVTVEAPATLPARGDALLLSRAVHNLLLNACEASPAGARVEVRAHPQGDDAVIEVLDRGPGLDPGVRERLFEPYVSTKRRGSGLGLSLVRDIALQHGGTVTLGDREGGGTQARLAIPLTGAATSTEHGGGRPAATT